MVIAIDGPAGVGKSTMAKQLAEKKGYFYLNSGNFYRAVTWQLLKEGLDPEDNEAVLKVAQRINFDIKNDQFMVNGLAAEGFLHTDEVDAWVAAHSAIPELRTIINQHLKSIVTDKDVVAEGRDMTTVVFPEAKYKFFLDASVDARAKRRFEQGNSQMDLEEIRGNIEKRDHIDRNKQTGNLKISEDAVYLDTTDLTINEVYDKIIVSINEIEESRSKDPNMIEQEKKSEETESEVKEVKEKMTQKNLQEEYLKSMDQMEEGHLLEGDIIQITPEWVFIDVGYKSEGKIPLDEFDEKPQIGDKVNVILLKKENKNGEIVVSKRKADERKYWKIIRDAYNDKAAVEGKIVEVINGGFRVDLGGGLLAFLPLSKADVNRINEPEKMIGLESKFYIERLYSQRKTNIVVSRRDFLVEKIDKARDEFFENVNIGDEVTGAVKSFTSFGAFIDLGGFDGLLHINDMSWGHVTRPKDYVKKGQEINLKVIKKDPEEKKINLSLKHFTPDPWVGLEERYSVGDKITGKVTKLTDFGAFIEIEEGVEGLAHISELSWVKRIKHPKEILGVGDEVEAMILGIDIQQSRIALGVKQVLDNPWETLGERYPNGRIITGLVKKITGSGAFIEIEEGIDAFLHVDDLSWVKKYKSPAAVLKEGQEVEAVVIDYNEDEKRVYLGIKQLSEDPWEKLQSKYSRGSIIDGTISSITDFGLFINVGDDIEGLLHKSNIPLEEGETNDNVLEKYKAGDKISAVVIEVRPDEKKLSLSLKEYTRQQEKQELSKYMHDEKEEESSGATIGDFLKNKDNDSDEDE